MSKNKINNFINYIHRILFNSEAGERTFVFAKNISFSFLGGLVAFVILFGASVVAARVLGPAEYGKYAVVFSIAQMLSLFYVLELDVSALYFLTNNSKEKKNIAASIVLMLLINIIIFTFFAISIYKLIMPRDISQVAFMGAIFIAFTFALKRMMDAFLRVENLFKKQAIFKVSEAIVVVGVLGISFFVLNQREYFSYVWAVILGGMTFTLLGGIVVKNIITIRGANTKCMNKVFRYNVFGLIGATVNAIVKNMDKLIIVALLGVSVGGVYAVYFTVSVIIGARITQLFINVFFPAVRADGVNVKNVFKKINKLFAKTVIPLIIIASGGVGLIIILYGSQYPFVWPWVILAGGYITANFFASLYGWLLSSVSRKGYKAYNMSFVYGIIIYGSFLWAVFMSDLFGITALLIGLIIYRIVGGVVSYFELKKII